MGRFVCENRERRDRDAFEDRARGKVGMHKRREKKIALDTSKGQEGDPAVDKKRRNVWWVE